MKKGGGTRTKGFKRSKKYFRLGGGKFSRGKRNAKKKKKNLQGEFFSKKSKT